MDHIRNFALIAHIDHGKSTVADRLIEIGGKINKKTQKEQMLDSMEIERERGITIKAQTTRLSYVINNKNYQLNLMDTPGHVDFSQEVNAALSACEGAVLIIDTTKGVEAQTIANMEKALEQNCLILPALNKIDSPNSNVKQTIKQLEGLNVLKKHIAISAKTGENMEELVKNIIHFLPAPSKSKSQELEAIWIDSWYNKYSGITILVRIISGQIKKKNKVFTDSKKNFIVEEVGIFTPQKEYVDALSTGEIGFIVTNDKEIEIGGERIFGNATKIKKQVSTEKKPLVFCSIFTNEEEVEKLGQALEKLHLNDRSFKFRQERSQMLGVGFRCGFLGMLHLEVIAERIRREFNIDITLSLPSVPYKILANNKYTIYDNVAEIPEDKITFLEPMTIGTLVTPYKYIGKLIQLCEKRRGKKLNHFDEKGKAVLVYALPLSEVISDFYNKLKSLSEGYATFEYKEDKYEESDLVKVNIALNGEKIETLSMIVHNIFVNKVARDYCEKLKEIIPRQQFAVAIQAMIGSKVVARETVSPYRKDVTGKCYGGDITRKQKLLKKQKEGKKKMRKIGKISLNEKMFRKLITFST